MLLVQRLFLHIFFPLCLKVKLYSYYCETHPLSQFLFQFHYHLSSPQSSQPHSKSNPPPSTKDTLSTPTLIASSRLFIRAQILLRGGKTMEANAVLIDPLASHAVLGVFARRFEVSSDLAAWSLVLVSTGLGG